MCNRRISVFLEMDGQPNGNYDFSKSKRPTIRKVVQKYLRDLHVDPLSKEDEVYFADTSDFPISSEQLLLPKELDEPISPYMGIVIRRKGENKN